MSVCLFVLSYNNFISLSVCLFVCLAHTPNKKMCKKNNFSPNYAKVKKNGRGYSQVDYLDIKSTSQVDLNVEISLSPHGPQVAQVGAAATVKEFLKLVQYSQSNHRFRGPVNLALSPLLCCNSAGKSGSKT